MEEFGVREEKREFSKAWKTTKSSLPDVWKTKNAALNEEATFMLNLGGVFYLTGLTGWTGSKIRLF